MSANVAIVDFTIYRNVDWDIPFQFKDDAGDPVVFTGSTFEMEIATAAGATATLTLDTGNGGIASTDLANGKINVVIADEALAAGSYVHDLVRITGSARELLWRGAMTVNEGVSQP